MNNIDSNALHQLTHDELRRACEQAGRELTEQDLRAVHEQLRHGEQLAAALEAIHLHHGA